MERFGSINTGGLNYKHEQKVHQKPTVRIPGPGCTGMVLKHEGHLHVKMQTRDTTGPLPGCPKLAP